MNLIPSVLVIGLLTGCRTNPSRSGPLAALADSLSFGRTLECRPFATDSLIRSTVPPYNQGQLPLRLSSQAFQASQSARKGRKVTSIGRTRGRVIERFNSRHSHHQKALLSGQSIASSFSVGC